jgi:hypothetical protein
MAERPGLATSEMMGLMSDTPQSMNDPAHDVLAAEAFAMPAPDPVLHHGPVTLPADPTGIDEPHDVLAAEDFAMPAPPSAGGAKAPRAASPRRLAMAIALCAAVVMVVRRLRRRP